MPRRVCKIVLLVNLGICLAASPLLAQCDNNPIAVDDEALVISAPVLIDVLANDQEPDGEALTLSVTGNTCPAMAEVLFDLIRLTPSSSIDANCALTYRIVDESSRTATTTVLVLTGAPIFADDFESGNSSAWTETCSGAGC